MYFITTKIKMKCEFHLRFCLWSLFRPSLSAVMVMWTVLSVCLLACVCWCAYARWRARQPWPDFGGLVVEVRTQDDWCALLESAAADETPVLVDFFATWCPPCRAAAARFARMSEEFGSVRFAKVNVDVARHVAAQMCVRAMPTFHLMKGLESVCSVRGWNEGAIRAMLEEHGVQDGGGHDAASGGDECQGGEALLLAST